MTGAIPEYFGCPSRQSSEIDQNQTKPGNEELVFLLLPEELRTENGQDEI
jgi:hypothetical protein